MTLKKLGVIHRGFSTYEKTKYRNIPEWQIAIELQSRFPDLPLICDPSHITGNRNMIQQVSQQALDLNYDGLIIETHTDPDNAWSDAAQQVTPKVLKQIFEDLKVKKMTTEEIMDLHEALKNLDLNKEIFKNRSNINNFNLINTMKNDLSKLIEAENKAAILFEEIQNKKSKTVF